GYAALAAHNYPWTGAQVDGSYYIVSSANCLLDFVRAAFGNSCVDKNETRVGRPRTQLSLQLTAVVASNVVHKYHTQQVAALDLSCTAVGWTGRASFQGKHAPVFADQRDCRFRNLLRDGEIFRTGDDGGQLIQINLACAVQPD